MWWIESCGICQYRGLFSWQHRHPSNCAQKADIFLQMWFRQRVNMWKRCSKGPILSASQLLSILKKIQLILQRRKCIQSFSWRAESQWKRFLVEEISLAPVRQWSPVVSTRWFDKVLKYLRLTAFFCIESRLLYAQLLIKAVYSFTIYTPL